MAKGFVNTLRLDASATKSHSSVTTSSGKGGNCLIASHHCPSASNTTARWKPQVGHDMPKNFLYVQGSS